MVDTDGEGRDWNVDCRRIRHPVVMEKPDRGNEDVPRYDDS